MKPFLNQMILITLLGRNNGGETRRLGMRLDPRLYGVCPSDGAELGLGKGKCAHKTPLAITTNGCEKSLASH